MKILYTLGLTVLIVGCAHEECRQKPITELKSMSRDSLLLELCSSAGSINAALRVADQPRIVKCVEYAGTIASLLRKDRKVDVSTAYAKGVDVGVTACLEEAKARGFYDAGKGTAAEEGRATEG